MCRAGTRPHLMLQRPRGQGDGDLWGNLPFRTRTADPRDILSGWTWPWDNLSSRSTSTLPLRVDLGCSWQGKGFRHPACGVGKGGTGNRRSNRVRGVPCSALLGKLVTRYWPLLLGAWLVLLGLSWRRRRRRDRVPARRRCLLHACVLASGGQPRAALPAQPDPPGDLPDPRAAPARRDDALDRARPDAAADRPGPPPGAGPQVRTSVWTLATDAVRSCSESRKSRRWNEWVFE